jgi:hypothetical protein
MPLNACELEIDLFCRGLRIGHDVSHLVGGDRRSVACSGVDVVIPAHPDGLHDIWANVPVAGPFARVSPYRLTSAPSGGIQIVDERNADTYGVWLPKAPQWYARVTSRGVPMRQVGTRHGRSLGIHVNARRACGRRSPRGCRTCTIGQHVGVGEARAKTIEDVIETCWAAREESGISHVTLYGGFQGARGVDCLLPYVEAIKDQLGMIVAVQLVPERDSGRYDALVEAGVDHLVFCLGTAESPRRAPYRCDGTSAQGQQWFLDSVDACTAKLPGTGVSGQILAGLEPLERTAAVVDLTARLGAVPIVCIYRPVPGSHDLWPPPAFKEIRRLAWHACEACVRHRVPIGAASHIGESLVVTPADARLLALPATSGAPACRAPSGC